jgi:hypothetical protein
MTDDIFIVLRLTGGLGNRLFQIATGLGLSKYWNCNLRIHEEINEITKHNSIINKYQRFYQPFICQGQPEHCKQHFSKLGFLDNKKIKKRSTYLAGLFQDSNNFGAVRNDILELIKPTSSELLYLREKYSDIDQAYFLHVRLGDYVSDFGLYIDLHDYYKKALAEIGDQKIYLLTNNKDQLAELYPELCYLPRIDEDEILSLFAMSICGKGGVISNSTFSWWGFYLNNKPNKKGWMPDKWVNLPIKSDGLKLPELKEISVKNYPWKIFWFIFLVVVVIFLAYLCFNIRSNNNVKMNSVNKYL